MNDFHLLLKYRLFMIKSFQHFPTRLKNFFKDKNPDFMSYLHLHIQVIKNYHHFLRSLNFTLRKTQLELIVLIIMLYAGHLIIDNHGTTLQKQTLKNGCQKMSTRAVLQDTCNKDISNSSVTSTKKLFTGHSNIQIPKNEKVKRKTIEDL